MQSFKKSSQKLHSELPSLVHCSSVFSHHLVCSFSFSFLFCLLYLTSFDFNFSFLAAALLFNNSDNITTSTSHLPPHISFWFSFNIRINYYRYQPSPLSLAVSSNISHVVLGYFKINFDHVSHVDWLVQKKDPQKSFSRLVTSDFPMYRTSWSLNKTVVW